MFWYYASEQSAPKKEKKIFMDTLEQKWTTKMKIMAYPLYTL